MYIYILTWTVEKVSQLSGETWIQVNNVVIVFEWRAFSIS